MNLFDIMGPIMIGPSSSHTAGAARIGYVARRLLGQRPQKARLLLHGSFAATGVGHGTDRALIAGILGLAPDDTRLPLAYQLATEQNLELEKGIVHLRDAHPNSVRLELTGDMGGKLILEAASLGGGRIRITHLDGLPVSFQAEYPTLVVQQLDQPGQLAKMVVLLAEEGINVANLHMTRGTRGGNAIVVAECDEELPQAKMALIRALPGVQKLTYLSLREKGGANDGL